MKTRQSIRWLTRQEAAQTARVSIRTIARMLADGTLTRHRTVGRYRVRIDAEELERLILGEGQ